MAKKKYYNSSNPSWFGTSEGDNGQPPKEVITRYQDPYSGNNTYYEQGMGYQDKQMMACEKGVKKQKLDSHF